MRNNRHISDIGRLVHEGTNLCGGQLLWPNIQARAFTYLFDCEAVGRRGHFSKHSITDTNALWLMHARSFHSGVALPQNDLEDRIEQEKIDLLNHLDGCLRIYWVTLSWRGLEEPRFAGMRA